ncbi:TetR/AcrR family transcriptional regulator [Oribacterium sp. WCC10]|uniref:TetR/AcrR family transcriptional regulator n=1 Tax=Oribacterium sp. WCC10 TaxID=1855343 RepID=UPI0008E66C33|nr:TetR/AcrR family transcriptional regulator [Oribacterium sp. WCC10]SFG34799.1 regulatory protein, tetR family [Oribacterium sp. WCC10]
MATKRFEKLSEEKKKRILDAAKEEFARVSFEEASINQIIKNAGISRGSFYTYFEDKNDLLRYIFDEQDEMNKKFLRELVLENDGDFWKAVTEWTRKVAGYLKEGSIQQRINIITNTGMMRRIVDWVGTEKCMEHDKTRDKEELAWLMENLNLSFLDYRGSSERFEAIVRSAHMLSGIAILNLIIYPNQNTEKILNDFNTQLDVLRGGADPRMNRSCKGAVSK